MPSSHFDQYGAYLALKTSGLQMGQADLPFVRSWLDDAPTHASPGSMASWGTITANLVQYLTNEKNQNPAEPDAQRLGAYFEAMRVLDPAVWWTSGPAETHVSAVTGRDISVVSKPVYKGFYDVCYMLAYPQLEKTNPLLKQLVEQEDWDPTQLLFALNNMRARQTQYSSDMHDWEANIQDTAQGQLLSALRPLVLDTRWRPYDTSLYGDMWLVHENRARHGNLIQAQRGREFVQKFAKSAPSQTDKMLAFMLSSDLRPQDIADFFPLRLAVCQARPALHALVGIFTDKYSQNGPGKAQEVEAQLLRHHPELLHLLMVHFSIFPDANRIDSMADVLVPGFDTLRGRPLDVAMAVPPGVFDEMSPSA